jgi:hypothetical protein
MLSNSHDQSFSGLLAVQHPNDNLRMRPTQMVYQAALFTAFGIRPLGYHAVNAFVLAAAVLLLYLILREIEMPLTVARAMSAVYLVLPNYSTESVLVCRLWLHTDRCALPPQHICVAQCVPGRRVCVLVRGCAPRIDRIHDWGMEIFYAKLAVPVALWLRTRNLDA